MMLRTRSDNTQFSWARPDWHPHPLNRDQLEHILLPAVTSGPSPIPPTVERGQLDKKSIISDMTGSSEGRFLLYTVLSKNKENGWDIQKQCLEVGA